MIEIKITANNTTLWNDTIIYAENCSWRAGKELARLMRENSFNGWERVFVAVENGKIIGFCTLTEKDELSPKYSYTPFIGFVFVDEEYRGRRISEKMIRYVTDYAKTEGFKNVYLMSGEVGLYEKYGFVKRGDYETIYGEMDQLFVINTDVLK